MKTYKVHCNCVCANERTNDRPTAEGEFHAIVYISYLDWNKERQPFEGGYKFKWYFCRIVAVNITSIWFKATDTHICLQLQYYCYNWLLITRFEIQTNKFVFTQSNQAQPCKQENPSKTFWYFSIDSSCRVVENCFFVYWMTCIRHFVNNELQTNGILMGFIVFCKIG